MAIVKSLGITGGVVLAVFIAAYLFLQAGQFFKELKKVGYDLLAFAIVIVIVVIAVVLAIEWMKHRS